MKFPWNEGATSADFRPWSETGVMPIGPARPVDAYISGVLRWIYYYGDPVWGWVEALAKHLGRDPYADRDRVMGLYREKGRLGFEDWRREVLA